MQVEFKFYIKPLAFVGRRRRPYRVLRSKARSVIIIRVRVMVQTALQRKRFLNYKSSGDMLLYLVLWIVEGSFLLSAFGCASLPTFCYAYGSAKVAAGWRVRVRAMVQTALWRERIDISNRKDFKQKKASNFLLSRQRAVSSA